MTHYHASPHALSDIITLWPHRSLSQRGFLIVMTAIATLCFIVGTGFFLLGAWPVIGFLGLEFVAVYLAFHYNYRAARAHEQLLIHEKGVDIIRVSPKGSQEHVTLPSLWLTAEVIKGRGRRRTLGLRYHRDFIEIGSFLPPIEKADLQKLINERLAAARLGQT